MRMTFEIMPTEMRPQDPNRDGTGCSFQTMWHPPLGDCMPGAILFTDAQDRKLVYVPMQAPHPDQRVLMPVLHGPPPLPHTREDKPTLDAARKQASQTRQ